MSSSNTHTALRTAFIAIGIAASVSVLAATASESMEAENDASRPVIATEQPPLPGAGHDHGNNLRAQMQAAPGAATALLTGDTIPDAFGQPLIAREVPAPPGTGPNSGDLARAEMQNDATAFAALGTRYPLAPGYAGV